MKWRGRVGTVVIRGISGIWRGLCTRGRDPDGWEPDSGLVIVGFDSNLEVLKICG